MVSKENEQDDEEKEIILYNFKYLFILKRPSDYPSVCLFSKTVILAFFTSTTPIITGAHGRQKGGYSVHTPYIVRT
jgi:hypothetical protein